jgi:hypothetical protein
MSNNIWNNPLMWQPKKTSKQSEDDDFDFDFDAFEKQLKEFQQESSVVDAAAKAAEYKETTPQMGNTQNPLDQKNVKGHDDKNSNSAQSNYLLNMLFGDTTTSQVPSLDILIGKGTYSTPQSHAKPIHIIFNDDADDSESDVALADTLGITIDNAFDKGVSLGLSPLSIVDNLDTLRGALALKKVTDEKLNSNDLTHLYKASLNNDTEATQSILDKKDIMLSGDISINDIMALTQSANNGLFKSAYLN